MNGILIATTIEANPFISGLRLELVTKSPFTVYKRDDWCLVISGIGKVNAALAAACLIGEYGAGRIYNLGTAGALTGGFGIGDIRHINVVYEHDRPLLSGGSIKEISLNTIDGLRMASLATGDIPVILNEERQRLSAVADLVDMEGAAVARACRRYDAEVFLFKAVSDCADTPLSEIKNNVRKASVLLFDYFTQKVL